MADTGAGTDHVKSPTTSEPSLQSESTSATSVSLEMFSSSDDDVFDMSEDYQHPNDGIQASVARQEMLSELPAMQRQHTTAGYREGLSASKAKSMQGGFDQGYPIGFELGLRVGKIFGVLEGFLTAFAKDKMGPPTGLVELYESAKQELASTQLLNGLDDEVLARLEFKIEDLPLKSREALQKWEEIATEMMKE
jgi:hypothetical protein